MTSYYPANMGHIHTYPNTNTTAYPPPAHSYERPTQGPAGHVAYPVVQRDAGGNEYGHTAAAYNMAHRYGACAPPPSNYAIPDVYVTNAKYVSSAEAMYPSGGRSDDVGNYTPSTNAHANGPSAASATYPSATLPQYGGTTNTSYANANVAYVATTNPGYGTGGASNFAAPVETYANPIASPPEYCSSTNGTYPQPSVTSDTYMAAPAPPSASHKYGSHAATHAPSAAGGVSNYYDGTAAPPSIMHGTGTGGYGTRGPYGREEVYDTNGSGNTCDGDPAYKRPPATHVRSARPRQSVAPGGTAVFGRPEAYGTAPNEGTSPPPPMYSDTHATVVHPYSTPASRNYNAYLGNSGTTVAPVNSFAGNAVSPGIPQYSEPARNATGNSFAGNALSSGIPQYNDSARNATGNSFAGNALSSGIPQYNDSARNATGNSFAGNALSLGIPQYSDSARNATGNSFAGNAVNSGIPQYSDSARNATENSFAGNTLSSGIPQYSDSSRNATCGTPTEFAGVMGDKAADNTPGPITGAPEANAPGPPFAPPHNGKGKGGGTSFGPPGNLAAEVFGKGKGGGFRRSAAPMDPRGGVLGSGTDADTSKGGVNGGKASKFGGRGSRGGCGRGCRSKDLELGAKETLTNGANSKGGKRKKGDRHRKGKKADASPLGDSHGEIGFQSNGPGDGGCVGTPAGDISGGQSDVSPSAVSPSQSDMSPPVTGHTAPENEASDRVNGANDIDELSEFAVLGDEHVLKVAAKSNPHALAGAVAKRYADQLSHTAMRVRLSPFSDQFLGTRAVALQPAQMMENVLPILTPYTLLTLFRAPKTRLSLIGGVAVWRWETTWGGTPCFLVVRFFAGLEVQPHGTTVGDLLSGSGTHRVPFFIQIIYLTPLFCFFYSDDLPDTIVLLCCCPVRCCVAELVPRFTLHALRTALCMLL